MNKSLRRRDYLLWYLLIGLSRLPMAVLYVFADVIYVLLFYITGYRKKVVLHNLKNSFPEKEETEISLIRKRFYRQFADVVVEILKMGSISPEEMRRRVHFTNPELPQQFIKEGRSVLVLGSHACNWEWILSSSSIWFDFPVDGVYKPLTNTFFETFMLHLRSRLGPHLVPMKDTLRSFIRRKNENRAIALLSDQTPPRGEIQYWTTFLNQETAFYVGADKLAAAFQYPVLFVGVRRLKRGYYEITTELIHDGKTKLNPDEHLITEIYARKLENLIRKYPADYLWSHKRWKHKRPATEPLAAALL